MSGNSTGDRVTRDDEEPTPRRPWLGEVTGLRLGEAPGEGKERSRIFSQNMSTCRILKSFMVMSHLLSGTLRGR